METPRINIRRSPGEFYPNEVDDLKWAGEHRMELVDTYGSGVALVYQQRVIGTGKTSHFHADHIASLSDLTSSRYIYMPHAFSHLRNPSTGSGHRLPPSEDMKHAFMRGLIPSDFDERSYAVDMNHAILLANEYAPFKKGYNLLGDESIIGVELPGHALGQMGVFVRDENDKLFFFVADAAWLKQSIVENRPPHKIADLIFSDGKTYRETLGSLHTYYLTHPDTHVIPSHCDETISQFQKSTGG